jgi:hypothetical protein
VHHDVRTHPFHGGENGVAIADIETTVVDAYHLAFQARTKSAGCYVTSQTAERYST